MRGMTTASFFSLAAIVMIAAVVAFAAAHILRHLGVVRPNPLRYLPHFVFLLIVGLTPVLSAGPPTLLHSLAVLGGVDAIWLAAVLASEYANRKSSGSLPNAR